jgi:hypothetical protein
MSFPNLTDIITFSVLGIVIVYAGGEGNVRRELRTVQSNMAVQFGDKGKLLYWKLVEGGLLRWLKRCFYTEDMDVP